MFEHVKIILELSSDPDVRAFALSLTIKDILCEVADLTTLETFDFFDLTLYRSTPCDEITAKQHKERFTAAAEKRGSFLKFY